MKFKIILNEKLAQGFPRSFEIWSGNDPERFRLWLNEVVVPHPQWGWGLYGIPWDIVERQYRIFKAARGQNYRHQLRSHQNPPRRQPEEDWDNNWDMIFPEYEAFRDYMDLNDDEYARAKYNGYQEPEPFYPRTNDWDILLEDGVFFYPVNEPGIMWRQRWLPFLGVDSFGNQEKHPSAIIQELAATLEGLEKLRTPLKIQGPFLFWGLEKEGGRLFVSANRSRDIMVVVEMEVSIIEYIGLICRQLRFFPTWENRKRREDLYGEFDPPLVPDFLRSAYGNKRMSKLFSGPPCRSNLNGRKKRPVVETPLVRNIFSTEAENFARDIALKRYSRESAKYYIPPEEIELVYPEEIRLGGPGAGFTQNATGGFSRTADSGGFGSYGSELTDNDLEEIFGGGARAAGEFIADEDIPF